MVGLTFVAAITRSDCGIFSSSINCDHIYLDTCPMWPQIRHVFTFAFYSQGFVKFLHHNRLSMSKKYAVLNHTAFLVHQCHMTLTNPWSNLRPNRYCDGPHFTVTFLTIDRHLFETHIIQFSRAALFVLRDVRGVAQSFPLTPLFPLWFERRADREKVLLAE